MSKDPHLETIDILRQKVLEYQKLLETCYKLLSEKQDDESKQMVVKLKSHGVGTNDKLYL